LNYFVLIRRALEHWNPNAPWCALALCSWLATYAVRRWCPAIWAAVLRWGPPGGVVEQVLQALPGAAASAVLGALGAGTDPWSAAKGAVAGLCAPLLHHLLKAIPQVPYRGALGVPLDGPTSRRVIADAINQELDKL
jgi:hypothetical protein